jgi:hypothetical protein
MKNLIKSKTFWVNILALLAMLLQAKYGFIIDPESQIAILAVVNVVLRAVTKEEIVWD